MKKQKTSKKQNVRKEALKMTAIFIIAIIIIEIVWCSAMFFGTKYYGGLRFAIDKTTFIVIVCFDIVFAILGYFDFKDAIIREQKDDEINK